MAKSRKTTVTVPVPRQDPPTEQFPERVVNDAEALAPLDFNSEADALHAAILELGDDASTGKVSIHRITKENPRQPIYVTEMLPSEFSMKRLADDFGGGRYNVRIYAPRIEEGTGRNMGVQLVKNSQVFIEGPPKIRKEETVIVAPTPAGPDPVLTLLQEMRATNERLLTALTQRPPEKSTTEQLRELVLLQKELAPPAPPPVKTLSEFEMFDKAIAHMERVRAIMPTSDGDGGGMGMLAMLAREIVSGVRSARAAPEVTPQIPDAGEPQPSAPDNVVPIQRETPQQDDEDPMNLIIRGYVATLVANAKANAPIEPIAKQIYDMAPEAMLRTFCADENYMSELEKVNKSAPLYKAYFDKLRAELIRLDNEPE
jgi:hypothetical protein